MIRPLRVVERDAILEALHFFNGQRNLAAAALGITVRGLRNKIRKYRSEGIPVLSSRQKYPETSAPVEGVENESVKPDQFQSVSGAAEDREGMAPSTEVARP